MWLVHHCIGKDARCIALRASKCWVTCHTATIGSGDIEGRGTFFTPQSMVFNPISSYLILTQAPVNYSENMGKVNAHYEQIDP